MSFAKPFYGFLIPDSLYMDDTNNDCIQLSNIFENDHCNDLSSRYSIRLSDWQEQTGQLEISGVYETRLVVYGRVTSTSKTCEPRTELALSSLIYLNDTYYKLKFAHNKTGLYKPISMYVDNSINNSPNDFECQMTLIYQNKKIKFTNFT